MIRRPPRATRTDTLLPYTTLFRSGKEITVCVLEKGSEVGAHLLSGAVLEPRALNELIPDWQEKGAPLNAPVSEEKFLLLSEKGSISMPVWMLPAQMHNHGNYVDRKSTRLNSSH